MRNSTWITHTAIASLKRKICLERETWRRSLEASKSQESELIDAALVVGLQCNKRIKMWRDTYPDQTMNAMISKSVSKAAL